MHAVARAVLVVMVLPDVCLVRRAIRSALGIGYVSVHICICSSYKWGVCSVPANCVSGIVDDLRSFG